MLPACTQRQRDRVITFTLITVFAIPIQFKTNLSAMVSACIQSRLEFGRIIVTIRHIRFGKTLRNNEINSLSYATFSYLICKLHRLLHFTTKLKLPKNNFLTCCRRLMLETLFALVLSFGTSSKLNSTDLQLVPAMKWKHSLQAKKPLFNINMGINSL